MTGEHGEAGVRTNSRAENERGYMAAAMRIRRSFVEDDEDGSAREREQRRQLSAQPPISCTHRAVVHRVAQVRNDEHEVGQGLRALVRRQLRQRNDEPHAAGSVDDAAEVDERVVLLGVTAETGRGKARRR